MKKLIYLCAGALLIAACAKKNDPVSNVRTAAKDKDLQENFVSDCAAKPGTALVTGLATLFQGKTAGYKVSYRFQGNNITKKLESYDNVNCQGDPNYEYKVTGTFDPKRDEGKKSNDGGYPIDIKYEKATLKIISDEGIRIANSPAIHLCSISDWAKNKERDISANAQNPNCLGERIPRQVVNRYRVDNKILTLGNESTTEKVNEKDRPSSLEATKYRAK